MRESRCPWPEGQAPDSWDDVAWPEWVPAGVIKQITDFWAPKWRRGPSDYEESVRHGTETPFGERVTIAARGAARPSISGRYVHAWNNVGRLIDDDGKWHMASDFDFDARAHERRAKDEESAAERRERLANLIATMDPSDLARFDARVSNA